MIRSEHSTTRTWAAEVAAIFGRPLEPVGDRLVIVGEALWVAVYVVAVAVGVRDGALAIPVAAVLLNVTWECLFAVWRPPRGRGRRLLYLGWLGVDLILLAQAWMFRPPDWSIATWTATLSAGLASCFLAHAWVFRRFRQPYMEAFGLNVIMSALFIVALLGNEDGRGLSLAIAWLKLFGTGFISVANVLRFVKWGTYRPLLAGLMVAITVLDLIYLGLLYNR